MLLSSEFELAVALVPRRSMALGLTARDELGERQALLELGSQDVGSEQHGGRVQHGPPAEPGAKGSIAMFLAQSAAEAQQQMHALKLVQPILERGM